MKRLLILLMLIICGCNDKTEANELYLNGVQAYKDRKLAEAEKFFISAIDKDSSLLNASLMLCKINYYNGNYKSAIEYADSILHDDPDHAATLYWKARSMMMNNQSDADEPVNLLLRCIEIDSRNIEARLLLGMLYEKTRHYRDALHQYMEVIEEEEGVIMARVNLALLYRRMGLIEKSENEFETAEKISLLSGHGKEKIKFIHDQLEADN